MDIWSVQLNKMGFLPSCSCIHVTIWMHHMEASKMQREKARWELHKNAACCPEQITEIAPHKTAVVWPPTPHLTNYSNRKHKTYKEKQVRTQKWCCLMDSYTQMYKCWPNGKDLHQVCADTRCCLEDIPGMMIDRDGWQEKTQGTSVLSG